MIDLEKIILEEFFKSKFQRNKAVQDRENQFVKNLSKTQRQLFEKLQNEKNMEFYSHSERLIRFVLDFVSAPFRQKDDFLK